MHYYALLDPKYHSELHNLICIRKSQID